MLRKLFAGLAFAAVLVTGAVLLTSWQRTARAFNDNRTTPQPPEPPQDFYPLPRIIDDGFQVEVLVDGRPAPEYATRGRRYIEAFEGAEYTLRIRNPLSVRIAVALSVDGLNTIDARHTSAWDAHKWVIEPYGTIEVSGWQMSSSRARHFYFTTERDSYANKLGQAANLGVISAVFFKERAPIMVTPAPPRPILKDESRRESSGQNSDSVSEARRADTPGAAKSPTRSSGVPAPPDDESAATGIGRSVRNDVQWIRMDLDSRPASETTIRYEYRSGLVRLGIVPRDYPRPNVLDRRERATGFEPRYSPEPR
jgi:hypothetical protein